MEQAVLRIGSVDVQTVDDCLNSIEQCFQSEPWKGISEEEKRRLVGRLYHIIEISGIAPYAALLIGDCLDVLQTALQSSMWRELPQEEKIRLIGRLSHILEITEKQGIEK
jgi:hypothetical protein